MKSFLAMVLLLSVALCSTIAAPVPTASWEVPDAVQPHLAMGTDGRVWLVYARITETAPAATTQPHAHAHAPAPKPQGHVPQGRDADLFVAWSDNGGATF